MNYETMQHILPIGSVVKLKDGDKSIMIVGRILKDKDTNKLYEYSGCYYPEGIFEPTELFLFQHEDIVNVIFMGLQNEAEKAFRSFMKDKLQELHIFL